MVLAERATVEAPEAVPWAPRPLEPEYVGGHRTSDPHVESEKPSPTSLDGLYEGTLKLTLIAGGSSQKVIRFMRELRREPSVSLLQLTGDPSRAVQIWLRLHLPLPLKVILSKMGSISQVDTGFGYRGDDPFLKVLLA